MNGREIQGDHPITLFVEAKATGIECVTVLTHLGLAETVW
jgi:hypothetical protein